MIHPSIRISRVLALVLFAAPMTADARSAITGARMGDHQGTTRFVLDLTEAVAFKMFTLPDPYRLVIDLPEVNWRVPSEMSCDGLGLIQRFRSGLFKPGTYRVVLDLKAPAIVAKAFTLTPQADFGHRIVFDLVEVTVADFRRSATQRKRVASPPAAAPAPKSPPRTDGKRVVVIDAGHGGVDPGATSVSGDYEKQIVLAAALELERQLKATGRYVVEMTRRRDMFVSLKKRIQIARGSGADFFISLHADAIANKKVSGATVYTLSKKASDEEAEKLATKENKADIIAGVDFMVTDYGEDVTNILIDLTQRETTNLSREFVSSYLIPELRKHTKLLRKSHRFAGFKVLKSPDVPSVLIEMGYLSSVEDERRLRDPKHRTKLMGAIVRAIDAYFSRGATARRS